MWASIITVAGGHCLREGVLLGALNLYPLKNEVVLGMKRKCKSPIPYFSPMGEENADGSKTFPYF